jgi:hypothetical protein
MVGDDVGCLLDLHANGWHNAHCSQLPIDIYLNEGVAMKSLKLLGVALMALFTVGVTMASSAFALPEINVTLTSAFPIHLEVTNLTIKTALTEEEGLSLKGEGILVLYLSTELTSLGKFEALFLKVEEKNLGIKCNTPGDKSGEVLTKGTWHLVWTSLSPLTLGILHLVSPFELECSIVKKSIKGSALAGLANPISGQLTALSGILEGNGKGTPNLTGYYLDSGQTAKAKLETNGVVSAEEVKGTVTTTALEGKMFEIEGA